MAAKFPELKSHVIVCGYGNVGQKVVDVLTEKAVSYVIIDESDKVVNDATDSGKRAMKGDATLSKTLKAASIESAKAIAIVMDNDAKNLFGVLTARDLNKEIFIATRANDSFVREKLIEAGADFVVMPQRSASREIARELFK
ncbi:MAG: NAD-binding protein [Candidatus Marsarchaeota archaeon]|nr:NAD-binding protein [Candidatus Marsarchaeota archaeon]